jgi:HK97 family phage prohead protease
MAERYTERLLIHANIERREEGGKRVLVGLIPFDSSSEEMWGTFEYIAPSAFTKTVKDGADVKALWNHNDDMILGRVKNQTLALEILPAGLQCTVILPDTTFGADAWASTERGDVDTMSFGFQAIKEENTVLPDGKIRRDLKEVKLIEVSFGVVFPAYPETDASAQMRAALQRRGLNLDGLAEVLATPTLTDEGRAKIQDTITGLQAIIEPKHEEPAQPLPVVYDAKADEAYILSL